MIIKLDKIFLLINFINFYNNNLLDYLNFLETLEKDLTISNKKYETVKFFRSEIVSVWIWFIIMKNYYDKKNNTLNIEKILAQIPSQYASRPKLLKIMATAVEKKYLIKKTDSNDKRKNFLEPSELTIKEFEEWAQVFKGF